MAQPAFRLDINFESVVCCKCGLPFAAPGDFFQFRRNDHEMFYCPTGHPQHFTAESEAEKLRDELAAEKNRKLEVLARLNESEAAKAKAERKLKRVGRGVCPDCNRTFANLAKHMNCKHEKTVSRVGAKPLPQ